MNMGCEAQTLYDSDDERVVRVTVTDFGPEHVSVFAALLAGSVPFAVGTVALGAISVAAAVLSTRDQAGA